MHRPARPHRSAPLSTTLLLLALLTLAIPLRAQTPPNLSQAPAADQLTPADLRARIDALKTAGGVDESTRTNAEALYKDALSALNRAAEAEKQRAKLLEAANPVKAGPDASNPAEPDLTDLDQKTSSQLQSELAKARAQATAAAQALETATRQLASMDARQDQLAKLLADAVAQVGSAEAAVASASQPGKNPVESAAALTAARARRLTAGEERELLQTEVSTFDARRQATTTRRDNARALAKATGSAIEKVRDALQRRLEADARAAEEAARLRLQQLQSKNPALHAAAQENFESAQLRKAIRADLPRLRNTVGATEKQRQRLQARLTKTQELVRLTGLTQTNGTYLRQQRTQLPNLAKNHSDARQRQLDTATIRVQLLEMESRTSADAESLADTAVAEASPPPDPSEAAELRLLATQIHGEGQTLLTDLRREYEAKLAELVALESEELQLARVVTEFQEFIDEKILWIRGSPPVWTADYWANAGFRWRELIATYAGIGAALSTAVGNQGLGLLALGLVFFGLVYPRGRLRASLVRYGEKAAVPNCSEFAPTLRALLPTILLAVPGPILALAAWLVLRDIDIVARLGTGPAQACRIVAVSLVVIELFRSTTRPGGIAEKHLSWSSDVITILRRHLGWFRLLVLPCMFLFYAADATSDATRMLLGQPAFLVGWLLFAVLLGNCFRPTNGLFGVTTAEGLHNARRLVFAVAVLAPLAMVAIAAYGYFFMAREAGNRFTSSLGLVFGLTLIYAIILRWQLVSRRRLAAAQRREAVLAKRERRMSDTGEPAEAPSIDVEAVGEQTHRLVRTFTVVTGLVGLFAIWSQILPALSALNEIDLWKITTVTETTTAVEGGKRIETQTDLVPITLGHVMLSLLILTMTVVAAKNLPGLLKLSLLQRFRPGNQYALATLTQYVIVLIGVVLAFGMIGVSWSKVQWLVAAVSVGLGFGLQEIFANFVSGLIILFEQPIRVGDFVTVGDVKGEVTKIRIRATTIRNLERRELIVPNKQFITGQVINWTLTDTINRITILVGIAYGSNVDLAREILMRVATENKFIVDEPKPKALFKEFGESALLFELRIFIKNLDHWVKAVDQVHSAIDREFRAAGIEIAFPQRDLHIRSTHEPVPVQT